MRKARKAVPVTEAKRKPRTSIEVPVVWSKGRSAFSLATALSLKSAFPLSRRLPPALLPHGQAGGYRYSALSSGLPISKASFNDYFEL
jgi:hypothetical protein